MKRAISSTLASRLYAEYSWEVLTSIAKNVEEITHPLFIEREKKDAKQNVLLILITSNRGLCGAYNSQIIKKVLTLLKTGDKDTNIDIIAIGKKGDMMMRRLGKKIIASFVEIPDNISLVDIIPISKLAIDEYSSGAYDKVLMAYTDFVSVLSQKPNIKQIIPISKSGLKDLITNLANITHEQGVETAGKKINYLLEGEKDILIGSLAEKLTRMQIYQMFLESNASEQSNRMIAMKNANEAAGEMVDDLTLMFNKARQAGITREISEISAGMVSLN